MGIKSTISVRAAEEALLTADMILLCTKETCT
jgi:hypothetical protein